MFANRVLSTSLRSAGRALLNNNKQQVRSFAVIRKFTKTHEWIEVDTDTMEGKMGITEHAAKELGDIVHVDLPEEGSEFNASDVIICVESVKTAADVYQMIDGEVLGVNEAVQDDASIVNDNAESEGWLISVKVLNISQLDGLMTAEEYEDFSE